MLVTQIQNTQVSNEALMKTAISNLSASDDVVIRSDFIADAATVTAALCSELEERLLEMMLLPANAPLFRVDFKPICNIQQLQEPHKFLVRPRPACPEQSTHAVLLGYPLSYSMILCPANHDGHRPPRSTMVTMRQCS